MADSSRDAALAAHLSGWLRDQVAQARADGLVVGLSGGVDSSVVLRLAQMASPEAVVGVVMPCHSSARDEADARLVARHFEAPVVRVELDSPCNALLEALESARGQLPDVMAAASSADERQRLALANVKPRLRMTSLYHLANVLGFLVAGTGNRSELAIGYYTKYGDGGVDLLPIGGLLKREVRSLARHLGVPAAIVEKPPSAGLWPGQTDEHEMGFGYDELERYLVEGPASVEPAVAGRIQRLIDLSEHKRASAPVAPIPE
jgi:NAD+ synthase